MDHRRSVALGRRVAEWLRVVVPRNEKLGTTTGITESAGEAGATAVVAGAPEA